MEKLKVSVQDNDNPYAGLENVVLGSTEYNEQMLSKPVSVRDGDDKIEVVTEEEDELEGVQPDSDEGDQAGEDLEEEGDELDSEEGEQTDSDTDELPEVDEETAFKSLEEAAGELKDAQEGQQAIIEQAIKNGLDAAIVSAIEAEFESKGALSEDFYKALAEAGFTRQFVNSYIKGQQAIVNKFVNTIVDYAGGQDAFSKLQGAIAENKTMAQAFNSAVERNDVATIKSLIDSAKLVVSNKFGKKPQRDLTKGVKAPSQAPRKVEGFSSRTEMVNAMKDPRYARDAAYRAQVEAKVIASNF